MFLLLSFTPHKPVKYFFGYSEIIFKYIHTYYMLIIWSLSLSVHDTPSHQVFFVPLEIPFSYYIPTFIYYKIVLPITLWLHFSEKIMPGIQRPLAPETGVCTMSVVTFRQKIHALRLMFQVTAEFFCIKSRPWSLPLTVYVVNILEQKQIGHNLPFHGPTENNYYVSKILRLTPNLHMLKRQRCFLFFLPALLGSSSSTTFSVIPSVWGVLGGEACVVS